MTNTERAELKRLAEAYAKGNMRRSAEGLAPALVGVDPAAVLGLLKEHEEDQGVIAVWRGRTERAEAENERLKAAARNVLAHIHDRHAPIQAGDMGIEDPSGINKALDALDDVVEGRDT